MISRIFTLLIIGTLLCYALAGLKVNIRHTPKDQTASRLIKESIANKNYIKLTEEEVRDMQQGKVPKSLSKTSLDSTIDLDNYDNSEYLGLLEIGNPTQKFN